MRHPRDERGRNTEPAVDGHEVGPRRIPVWSPSGHTIAFSAFGRSAVHEYTYFMFDLDSDRIRKLTRNRRHEEEGLAWSPDGARVAYAVSRSPTQGAPWELRLATADGRRDRRLASEAEAPAWSPDGQMIAFERCKKKDATGYSCQSRDIYVVNPSTGTSRALTRTVKRDERNPRWSPDGSRISFEAYPSAYVMRSDGTGVRKVLNWAYGPAFSRDWQRIGYLGGLGCEPSNSVVCDLRIANGNGTNVQRLLAGRPVESFAWQGTVP